MIARSSLIAAPSPEATGQRRPDGATRVRRSRMGWIVGGSLATGAGAAALLVAAPLGPATESAVTGSVLCGFALGWAMLAVLSTRCTDRPQRWAFAPALVMGIGGLLLVLLGSPMRLVLSWVLPPVMLALAIWMMVRVGQRLHGSRTRWLLYPVIAMLALSSVGAGYQALGEAADAQAPIPGRLIDVGGHRLHLHCTGSGSPTVVLEAGGGNMSSDLWRIAPSVASDTRVCAYDRAGRGWSDPAPSAPHGIQIATDLHTLLERGGESGPYVLAGHSFGGLYAQVFAARYPSEVVGMVLIDSTAPNAAASEHEDRPYVLNRVFALAAAPAQLGLGRLASVVAADGPPLDGDRQAPSRVITAADVRSTIDEYASAGDAAREAASLSDLGDTPLIVVTASSGHDAASSAAQARMAALSTNSAHRLIAGATHAGLVAEPDGAAATARAILDVVSSVRDGGSLLR